MPYFTEEQLALRESIRRMVDKEIRPIAAEIDTNDQIPERIFHLFGDLGLMQLWVPEEYGGPGGNLTSVCIAREEISRISEACALIAGMNSIGMILPLLHFGTEAQKKRWLPLVAKGRLATSSGSDGTSGAWPWPSASAFFSSTCDVMAFIIACPARPKSSPRLAVAQSCDVRGAASWPLKCGITFSANRR